MHLTSRRAARDLSLSPAAAEDHELVALVDHPLALWCEGHVLTSTHANDEDALLHRRRNELSDTLSDLISSDTAFFEVRASTDIEDIFEDDTHPRKACGVREHRSRISLGTHHLVGPGVDGVVAVVTL